MDPSALRSLLKAVRSGRTTPDAALQELAALPFTALDVAHVDHHRALRCGFAEVVFAQSKTPGDVVRIVRAARAHAPCVLVTRATEEHARALKKAFRGARHNTRARTVRLGEPDARTIHPGLRGARVEVLTAGTSDIPVAEEALETLAAFGCPAKSRYDLGVAGLHRILGHVPALQSADALIVCAGMEGALPSVAGGLVAGPVVAVPTSVGYGASFNGLAALLGMLNTCASGVSVVNIDNGFGAAMAVLRMLRLRAPRTESGGSGAGNRTRSVKRARPRTRRIRNGGEL